jgi:hypothetical protein
MALLIREIFNEECEVLTETNDNGKKSHYIQGIFMQSDVKNRNGRIYPSSILEKEMHRYNEQFIKTKRALGELNHPQGPQINADRVSHLITELNRNGTNFIGKAKILSTPMGEIVKTFIDEGVRIGVSTRGLGSVKPTNGGIMEVQDDFHLATVDIVTDPSGPDCFVNGILENTQYYFDIATSSWLPSALVTETKIAEETPQKEYVSLEAFNAAMDRLQVFEDIIVDLKEHFNKPSKRMDQEKALQVLESYLRTLN